MPSQWHMRLNYVHSLKRHQILRHCARFSFAMDVSQKGKKPRRPERSRYETALFKIWQGTNRLQWVQMSHDGFCKRKDAQTGSLSLAAAARGPESHQCDDDLDAAADLCNREIAHAKHACGPDKQPQARPTSEVGACAAQEARACRRSSHRLASDRRPRYAEAAGASSEENSADEAADGKDTGSEQALGDGMELGQASEGGDSSGSDAEDVAVAKPVR